MIKEWWNRRNSLNKFAIKFSIWTVGISSVLLFLLMKIDFLFSIIGNIPILSNIVETILIIFAYGVWFGIATILTDHGFKEGLAIPLYIIFYIFFGYLLGALIGFLLRN